MLTPMAICIHFQKLAVSAVSRFIGLALSNKHSSTLTGKKKQRSPMKVLQYPDGSYVAGVKAALARARPEITGKSRDKVKQCLFLSKKKFTTSNIKYADVFVSGDLIAEAQLKEFKDAKKFFPTCKEVDLSLETVTL